MDEQHPTDDYTGENPQPEVMGRYDIKLMVVFEGIEAEHPGRAQELAERWCHLQLTDPKPDRVWTQARQMSQTDVPDPPATGSEI